MSETTSNKKFPPTTPETSRILGLDKVPQDDHDHGHTVVPTKTSPGPSHLPVVDSHVMPHAAKIEAHEPAAESARHLSTEEEVAREGGGFKRALKALAPYLAVFAAGLVIYYFFLGNVDISGWVDKIKPAPAKVQNIKETALQNLQKQYLADYQKWISQYYFDVSDTAITDPNADNSGNGLSNFQKYILNLNPKSYDTLGLGMADSQALAQGINPATGDALTDKQKQVVEQYFDMEAIMNRLSLSHLNQQQVAGAATGQNNNQNNNNYNNNNNSNNNQNGQSQGYIYQTNINANNYTAPQTGADVNGKFYDVDQTRPGLLEIPSLKISAPLIFTQDPKNFDTDLQSGVVHYPGTALPGQIGTVYISGHSSNYAWAKGSYNRVFSKLGDLPDNASFAITVYLKNGKSVKFHYAVTRRAEYKATDQEQFKNAGVPTVALSTCWPVNTTQKRLVVFGQQTQVDE